MVKRCTWDCSHVHYATVRDPVTPDPYPPKYPRLCEFAYCTHPDHPKRRTLPACARDAREGALVTFASDCSLKEREEPLTLF